MVSALVNKINSSFERDHTVEWEVSQTDGLVVFLLAINKMGYSVAGELVQLLGSFLRGDIS